MKSVYMVLVIVALALASISALIGGWCLWRVRSTPWFWKLLRGAQIAAVAQVAWVGVLAAQGHKQSGLHILYAVLPLLGSLIAEQFRALSAQMVLDARGHKSAEEVGALPVEEQRIVVMTIMQREIAVMALSSLVNVVLLSRALGTA